MSWPPELDAGTWRLIVAVATFLAACHAYLKLSPYFCVTWFGAGLVFGWQLSGGSGEVAPVLLPMLVVYLAAALTKGLVETRDGVRGNHLVHVLLTGVLAAVVALPIEASSAAMGWPVPHAATRALLGVQPGSLGGVTLDVAALWAIAGTLYYGTYKVLDHVGLRRAEQTILLFVAAPLLAPLTLWLHELL